MTGRRQVHFIVYYDEETGLIVDDVETEGFMPDGVVWDPDASYDEYGWSLGWDREDGSLRLCEQASEALRALIATQYDESRSGV